MKIKHIREDDNVNAAIEVMMSNMYMQDDSDVGCFWYDTKLNELFGVNAVPSSSMSFYHSNQFNADVRTGPRLHQSIWKKESIRCKDKRFNGDYTLIPRGRVFEFKDQGFVVFTGDWINEYPEAKSEILLEFNLPNNTEFRIDEHWNIGRSWSDEF